MSFLSWLCHPYLQDWRADKSMAGILLMMALSLLMQGSLCSVGQTDTGCMKWIENGGNVCCVSCHPGNRLIHKCGQSPKELCKPCEPGTYTMNPKSQRCDRCTQCVGAQVLVKECTTTTDTKCGCKEGLTCGDGRCSFCVEKCGKGHEPTEKRSCRPCPDGTFNNQTHQRCKPWSTKCPNPDEEITDKGDAFSDIKCTPVVIATVSKPNQPAHTERAWPLVLFVVTSIMLMAFIIIIVAMKTIQRRKKTKKKIPETLITPIIRTPTDDPRTLMAIECSFHEAQQEQGSSSESLASKDSSDQLIA